MSVGDALWGGLTGGPGTGSRSPYLEFRSQSVLEFRSRLSRSGWLIVEGVADRQVGLPLCLGV